MNSKQRAYIRGMANTVEAIFQIGKNGISKNLIKQIDEALTARELIKITVLETVPDNKKDIAIKIANLTNSELIQILGNKITLYRKNEKNPKIIL